MRAAAAGYATPNNVEWERGIGPADPRACGPVRTIPITPVLLAAEDRRAKQIPRTTADEWRKSLGLKGRI